MLQHAPQTCARSLLIQIQAPTELRVPYIGCCGNVDLGVTAEEGESRDGGGRGRNGCCDGKGGEGGRYDQAREGAGFDGIEELVFVVRIAFRGVEDFGGGGRYDNG
ncbi:hypothetical protein C0991_002598, partial [Blastosporella zonata]